MTIVSYTANLKDDERHRMFQEEAVMGEHESEAGSEPIVDGMQLVPLPGHTPGHTGYEFSSKGQ